MGTFGEHDLIGHDTFVYEPLTSVPLVCMVCLQNDPFSLVDIRFIFVGLPLPCSFSQTKNPIRIQREGEIAILGKDWNNLCINLFS